MIDKLPQGVDAYYSHAGPNDPIGLYRGALNVRVPEGLAELDALISLRWVPSPQIVWEGVAPLTAPRASSLFGIFSGASDLQTTFPEITEVPPQLAEIEGPATPEEGIHLSGLIRQEIRRSDGVRHVVFAVPNFEGFIGHWVGVDGAVSSGIAMDGGPWRVTLTGRGDSSDALKQLEMTGGFLLTHSGRLERRDGREFSVAAAKRALNGLTLFFWFARGLRTAPILPVGFDEKGEAVWANWQLPSLDRWESPYSWLDRAEGGTQLQDLFPGFMRRWQTSLWREALTLAIEYYVDANTGSTVNSGVLSAQIALELIAWTLFVQEQGSLAANQFKPPFSKILGRLLDEFGLPREIPSELRSLRRLAAKRGWQDGPAVLTAFRNEVAHLRSRSGASFAAWIDAWRLAVWYLELVLLGLMGFDGSYANRLKPHRWLGEVEAVPWSP